MNTNNENLLIRTIENFKQAEDNHEEQLRTIYSNLYQKADKLLQNHKGLRIDVKKIIEQQLIVMAQQLDVIEKDLLSTVERSRNNNVDQTLSVSLPPIQPLPICTTDGLPCEYELSPAQRSLWLHAQMDDSGIAYNLSMSLLLEGDLHITALKLAFEAVVARHESLRTTFVLVEDEPKQRVHDLVHISQELVDISIDISKFENSQDIEKYVEEYHFKEARKPFDLTQSPLIRVLLLKLSDYKYVLIFTIHHIIIDGWSLDILEHELFSYYAIYKLGKVPQITPLKIQYKDYAAWYNSLFYTDRLRKQGEYWRDKLANTQAPVNLPTDFFRPAIPTFNGDVITLIFEESLSISLNRFSRKHGATVYMFLVAAVKTLLYRITQQNDIIIGSSLAERAHPDLEGQIGFFINPLALRDIIDGNNNFLLLLHQVRQTILEALENSLYPFEAVVNELQQKSQNQQLSSLFEIQVVMHNHPQNHTQQDGLKVSTLNNVILASRFDLIFNFIESDNKLQLDIEYKTDLWKPERIELIKERFYALVMDIIAYPEKKLNDLNIRVSHENETDENELVFSLDF